MLIPVRTGEGAPARNEAAVSARGLSVETWLLIGVTVVGAALRFATLTSQSYWFDEAQAAHELHLSFGAMLSSWSVNEPNPPLFFVIGWVWAHVFGTGEAGLRSLSAVAGTAAIPITYLCARELVSRRAALVAAALVALSPFMIWYSQEAREYMLLAALCGGSLLFFARAWREPTARNVGWWALLSALALLTQYFAAFLVAAMAIGLLYRSRSRAVLIAVGVLVVVEAALLPHAISHEAHPAGWIDTFSLAVRVKQVPVDFGLGALYQNPDILSYGLLGAAILVGVLIVLLVIGADSRQLRGAGLAAAVGAAVLLVPLALALFGHDYYEARALMPAWIPLAVVIAAACAVPRARVAGAALAVVVLGAFVYAQSRIESDPSYKRSNWRGVANALGVSTSASRAIVAYDGTFATAPLAIYLPGVAWTGSGQIPQTSQAPVTVGEVDVVGSVWQHTADPLPAGASLLSSQDVDGYRVQRFSVTPAWRLPPALIGRRAPTLLGPAPSGPGVLIQQRS
jgi:4-amino-4-deoxy-L-arabinose transferase-like glycosyltransferase